MLQRGLARKAGHPLAAHLLIHVTESLPTGRGPNSAGERMVGWMRKVAWQVPGTFLAPQLALS